LPPLLAPVLWERTANIPALVRLLQAFLQKGGKQIVAAKQLEPILGVFQKLVASKINDHEGFYLLEAIVQFLSP
jgi:exportin-2 (importin alpha re-exporter)